MSRIQPSSSETSRRRNADTNLKLFDVSWSALRFWAHESPIEATDVVAQTVAIARSKRRTWPAGAHKKN